MFSKIVVVGSCMIDFTSFAPRLPKAGETIIARKFEIKYGGKGANQCVQAVKLGASATIVACLGYDIYAQEYLKIFKKLNIDTTNISIVEDQHSGIANIIVADNGENSIVTVLGANESLSTKHVDSAADTIKSASVLLCQFETSLESTLHALKLYKGHGFSIVNGAPATAKVDSELLSLCDVFCVNETETEVMTGVLPEELSSIQEAIGRLLDMGCNTVILTLGERGAAYASREDRTVKLVPTTSVQPVDSTGAGDAFLGAFAYFKSYHPDLTMDECVRRSCYVATQSVLKFGTHSSFATRDSLSPDLFV
ncbi:ribokinase-like [Ceratina calcarata]|uniref:Ribokinase n=1 Tax=Ceratina calcarata TaxID=156304 RepID=A0AAJ7J0X4_9HYME|nr:ribokinase-like [Ceratina calcarata]